MNNSAERGKTRSKRSGLNEELIAIAMGDEEDRSAEAAAGRIVQVISEQFLRLLATEKFKGQSGEFFRSTPLIFP